jgi:hypothetical protein
LPGACGSVDVVHIKWGCCPTGDINRAKGKEGYPTFAYQCITNFNQRIIGIYGPAFGSRNDKDIVKTDPNVKCKKGRAGIYEQMLLAILQQRWQREDLESYVPHL